MNHELVTILDGIIKNERYKQYRLCMDIVNKDIGCAGLMTCDNCLLQRHGLFYKTYPQHIIGIVIYE